MSIDLTEAIQAAMEGFCGDLVPPVAVADLSGIQQHVIREQALSYVTHAAPRIEAAVREQIARDLTDYPSRSNHVLHISTVLRIARGEQP